MRLADCVVALIAVAVASTAVSYLSASPTELLAAAENTSQGAERSPAWRGEVVLIPSRPGAGQTSSTLDDGDEIAALEAIGIALAETGDGYTFIWKRENGRISGAVKPTSSFRAADGRICRHLVLVLAAGPRTGKVEGIACRASNGRWQLEG